MNAVRVSTDYEGLTALAGKFIQTHPSGERMQAGGEVTGGRGFFVDWDGLTRRVESPGFGFRCELEAADGYTRVLVINGAGFVDYEAVHYKSMQDLLKVGVPVRLLCGDTLSELERLGVNYAGMLLYRASDGSRQLIREDGGFEAKSACQGEVPDEFKTIAELNLGNMPTGNSHHQMKGREWQVWSAGRIVSKCQNEADAMAKATRKSNGNCD